MVLVRIQPTFRRASKSRGGRGALAAVDVVIATGNDPASVFGGFARAIGIAPPTEPIGERSAGASVWLRREGNPPLPIEPVPAKAERRRHRRKYAQGELPPDRNFVFRGPQGKLNLRAQNLQTFLQMGEGVDDETWTHHLEGHDYSSWIRQAIKDEALAADLEKITRTVLETIAGDAGLKASVSGSPKIRSAATKA